MKTHDEGNFACGLFVNLQKALDTVDYKRQSFSINDFNLNISTITSGVLHRTITFLYIHK